MTFIFRVCYLAICVLLQAGCILNGKGLNFPAKPLDRVGSGMIYDMNANGVPDFHVRSDASGRLDILGYDQNEDGVDERIYRLSQYDPDSVPHLILLLDSIPYAAAVDRSATWTWFDPPQKVIPPFPTMSGVIFTRLLHAPPLGGMINQYYDRATGTRQDRIFARAGGSKNPWELRLHYRLKYWENGLSFLNPRACFATELRRVKEAVDASPDRVTIVYVASTAGMVSKHAQSGIAEVLDGVEQLCLNLFYERQGAIKISVMADHGHNLIEGERIDIPEILRESGFTPTNRLEAAQDVVVELDGLVNYAGVHTRCPAEVATALVQRPQIELAIYLEGERVIVQSGRGRAAIERRGKSLRYAPIDADVLEYEPVVQQLQAAGHVDTDGFVDQNVWFAATVDHHWPDAPFRLWEAFHGLAINTPDVMMTTAPGYFVGLPSMERYVTMASTHGGLDQIDSATFVLSMNGRAKAPMRTGDVLPTIEPFYTPDRKPE